MSPKLAPVFFDHFRFEIARRFCRYLRSADDVVICNMGPTGPIRINDGPALEECITRFYASRAQNIDLTVELTDRVAIHELPLRTTCGGRRDSPRYPYPGFIWRDPR